MHAEMIRPPFAPGGPAPLTGDETTSLAESFRQAMRRIAATVTIVTASNRGDPCGVTATSVTSVAMSPPSLLVCLHQQGAVRNQLRPSQTFCVNVLRAGHEDLSRAFAGGLPQEKRFSNTGQWLQEDNVPYLADAQCTIFCVAERTIDWGTHTIFLGAVRKVLIRGEVLPLLYCNGVFGRLELHSQLSGAAKD